MEITEVKVFPVTDGEKLKAYVQVVFDNELIIKDLKLIEGVKGLFVSMPSRKRKDGTFRDIVHPIISKTRNMIEERIIQEYNNVMDLGGAHSVADEE
ncbi:MAG TPA: septation regulator SpoVG [Candidatus Babeliales bacterium]|jgi:stage V sporulation protein G|nr:septation regulator SpoVG [Candidatus Babeliales bacterium]